MMYECQHEFMNNICIHCNLVIEKFFENNQEDRTYIRDSNKYNIIDQLEGIPPEVIHLAKQNIIRKQKETGKKVRNDKKNTFIQIYEAYVDSENKDLNPHHIAKQLQLSRKEINWCLKIISQTSLVPSVHEEVNKHISIVIISPIAYIKKICYTNDLKEHEETLTTLVKYILKEKDILFSSRPEYVACAIVKKFCEAKNISIKSYSKKNKISDNALKKAISDIDEFF